MTKRRAKNKNALRKTAIVPRVVRSLALAGVVPLLGMGCNRSTALAVAAIFDGGVKPDLAVQFTVAAIFDMAVQRDYWSPGFDVAAVFDFAQPPDLSQQFTVAAIFDMSTVRDLNNDGGKG